MVRKRSINTGAAWSQHARDASRSLGDRFAETPDPQCWRPCLWRVARLVWPRKASPVYSAMQPDVYRIVQMRLYLRLSSVTFSRKLGRSMAGLVIYVYMRETSINFTRRGTITRRKATSRFDTQMRNGIFYGMFQLLENLRCTFCMSHNLREQKFKFPFFSPSNTFAEYNFRHTH